MSGTALWGWTISASGLFIAITSPILGYRADRKRQLIRYLLIGCTLIVSLSCILLWFSGPYSKYIIYTLVIIFISNSSFEIAQVFYNSQLVKFKENTKLGRFSGTAWAAGYIGGICCLALVLFLFVLPEKSLFGLDKNAFEHIRACGPIVGIWFLLFSLPFLINFSKLERKNYITDHEKFSFFSSIKFLIKNKSLRNFLIARMFYTDGLITLFSFGGIYASGTFNFNFNEIIVFGIMINISAAIGAYMFGFLEDKLGMRKVILISLICLIIISIGILLTSNKTVFWFLGFMIGFFIGSVQSSSRTAMISLSNKRNINQLFGLYAVSGKITNFIGPFLVASLTAFFESQRVGMSSILIFLIIGAFGIYKTQIK